MKHTAQGLASLGRGPDTELVHMTKGEVHGLQKLAMAHGGTLTINPETGLAEAGFLSSILPMAIGAGAMMIPGLQGFGAAGIAAGIGGMQALRTGSLSKGLMAGLGAYGGAGLVAGLAGAGATGAAGEAMASAPAAAGSAAAPTVGGSSLPGFITPNTGLQGLATGAPTAGSTALGSGNFVDAATGSTLGNGANMYAIGPTGVPVTSYAERVAAGARRATSSVPNFMNFAKDNSGVLISGGMGVLGGLQSPTADAPAQNQGMIRPYTSDRRQVTPQNMIGADFIPGQNPDTSARQWYTDNNQYTALTPYKAPGPEYLAGGGPVEAMSNANAIGANTGYPLAGVNGGAYSAATQMPISQNVVQGPQDPAVDPYTGQAQFAEGGNIGGYSFDRDTGMYSVVPTSGVAVPTTAGNNFFGLGRFNGGAAAGAPAQYANGSIGGYSFDPTTGQYTKQDLTPAYLAYQNTQQTATPNSYETGQDNAGASYGGGVENGGDSVDYAQGGGISDLGSYSDGGQLLRGGGDGVSDSIPAQIGKNQPARLADGEFVIPARIVSELGNGSTEAGSRQLYSMMDRIQKARKKSIGKDKVATNSRAAKLLPA